MKGTVFAIVLLLLTTLVFGFQQAPQPSQQTLQTEGLQSTAPVKPPRVVGQPQSQEEWDAWQIIEQAAMPQKKELLITFLQDHPESGLTANANFVLARYYDQIGDVQNYMLHAEKTLKDIPDTVDFLARLAFYYSEQRKTSKAIQYGSRVLDLVDQLVKPDNITAIDFVTQLAKLKSEANYALGRANLNTQEWEKSASFLNEALKFDPRHDYACFRLALAHRNLNNAGEALMAYGRAVAIGSVAAGPSQGELENLLQIVKDNMPDSEWAKKSSQEIIQMASQQLQEESERLNSELSYQAKELEAVDTGLGIGLPPPPGY